MGKEKRGITISLAKTNYIVDLNFNISKIKDNDNYKSLADKKIIETLMCEHEHPVNTLHQQMIFPDENAPIHRKKSVVTAAASGRSIGTVLAEKKKPGGGGARKALNDITNKSSGVLHPKASSNNK
ncbi:Uncharacterized protein Rs2_26472 [Raphanus sativus]|nr:Uncharacterized protein Rs2_26472 [Raphanus sativus]